MSRRVLAAAALVLWLLPGVAAAHGFHPGSLVLVETEPGAFSMSWTAPVDTAAGAGQLSLDFPDHCRPLAAALDCGPAGLFGDIAVRGLAADRGQVAVWIRFLDSAEVDALITGAAPRLSIDRAPGPDPGLWARLGAERALAGLAPLAFVLGLVLVAGASPVRRLAAALGAFAGALAAGLALAATGVASAAAAPLGALVAAGVVLVAAEALRERPTLTRRAPWLWGLAAGGAVGLGLGAALVRLGTPPGWLAPAVAASAAGAAAALVGAAAAAALVGRFGGAPLARLRPTACYALGGAGAWQLFEGAIAIATGP